MQGARNPSEIIQNTLCVRACVCVCAHARTCTPGGRRSRAPTRVFPMELRTTALTAVTVFLTELPSTPSGSQGTFIPGFKNDVQRHEDAQITGTVWFQILTSRVTEPICSINLNDTHPRIQPGPPPLRAQGRQMLQSLRPKGLSVYTHTHTHTNTCTCKHPSQAGSDFHTSRLNMKPRDDPVPGQQDSTPSKF